MAKRFHDIKVWEEDWFICLPTELKLFWFYLKDNCDHAGIWRPKVLTFNRMFGFSIDVDLAFDALSDGGKRIQRLKNGHWFITSFFPFQYGMSMNLSNRVHLSVYNIYQKEGVKLTSIRPQIDLTQGLKDKDKDKDKEKHKEWKEFIAGVNKQYISGAITMEQKDAILEDWKEKNK
jgi:hypothetical protein